MDGHLRVELLLVAAELADRVAHRRQIDHAGDAGEILHQDARRTILDLAIRAAILLPIDDRLKILGGDGLAVLEAQKVFEQNLHREGQSADIAELLGRLGEAVEAVGGAGGVERVAGAERVLANGGHAGIPRSEEHTSELQSLMRISYAVFCLKNKKQ